MSLSLEDYKKGTIEASKEIYDVVLRTPLLKSNWLSKSTSCNVYLKMESEQITRSFKLRGAAYKCKKISGVNGDSSSRKKVITSSSGNHALACAHMSSKLALDLIVYVNVNVSKVKADALRQYSTVELIKYGSECSESEEHARSQAELKGLQYISPYNDNDIICGQGTISHELLEQLPELDAVFVPVGGGGLVSGIAAYLKMCKPSVMVVGCQPVNDCCMYESVKRGSIVTDNIMSPTFADGIAGRIESGSVTFDVCKEYIDQWVLLEEDEIERAVYDMMNMEKKLVEGSAGLTIAAIQKVQAQFKDKNVALIMTGANVGVDMVKRLVDKFY